MNGTLDIVNLEEAGRRLGLRNFRWYRSAAIKGKYKPFPDPLGKVGRVNIYDMNQINEWYTENVNATKSRRGERKD